MPTAGFSRGERCSTTPPTSSGALRRFWSSSRAVSEFRYLAFVWHDLDPAARDAARRLIERHSSSSPEWHVAVRKRGLYVGYAGATAGSSELYLLADGAGAVLGRLFERANDLRFTPARLAFDEQETRAIVATGGRRVIDRYWG